MEKGLTAKLLTQVTAINFVSIINFKNNTPFTPTKYV